MWVEVEGGEVEGGGGIRYIIIMYMYICVWVGHWGWELGTLRSGESGEEGRERGERWR